MEIERTHQRQYEDDFVDTLSFTLDGKDNYSTFWNSPRIISAYWAKDGDALTIKTQITFNRDGEESRMHSIDIWSLNSDASEISRDFTINGQWGEMKAAYVFSRILSLGNNQREKGK